MTTAYAGELVALDATEIARRLLSEYETDLGVRTCWEKEDEGRGRRPKRRKAREHGVLLFDSEGQMIAVNPQMLGLLGRGLLELGKKGIGRIFADPLEMEILIKEIGLKGYIIDYRARLLRGDGSEMDCLVTATARWYNDEMLARDSVYYKAWIRPG